MKMPEGWRARRTQVTPEAVTYTITVDLEPFRRAMAAAAEAIHTMGLKLRETMRQAAERQYPGDPLALEHLTATHTLSKALTETRMELRRDVALGRAYARQATDTHLNAWRYSVLGCDQVQPCPAGCARCDLP